MPVDKDRGGKINCEREESVEISPHIRDYLEKAPGHTALAQPDGLASITGLCGDTIEMSISLSQGTIEAVGFTLDGCEVTRACAAMVAELARGKTLEEARRGVTPMAVDESLGGIPEDHGHCARLATSALWAAIDDALATRREPWRRAIRSL